MRYSEMSHAQAEARKAYLRGRVILCNGCFDPIHHGHLLHLRAARTLGDRLVVALSSDAAVREQKGEKRLFLGQQERAELLMQLRCVSGVVIVEGLLEGLERVRPDVLVKGNDYKAGLEAHHAEYCRQHGIAVAFTDTQKWSILEIADELRRR